MYTSLCVKYYSQIVRVWQEQSAWAQNLLELVELELDLKGRQAFGRRKWAFQRPEQSMAARLGWEGQGHVQKSLFLEESGTQG